MAKEKIKEDATPASATLMTRPAAMSGILAAISSMSNDELMKWFPDAMALAGQVPNAAAQNAASIRTGVVKEDVLSLFEGDSLTEDAQEKILTLVEHAVSVQSAIVKATLDEEFATKLEDEVIGLQEAMEEKVNSYLTYAAEQWMTTNELAIESTLVVEKAKRLFAGLSALMVEANLEVNEAEQSTIDTLNQKVAELEEKLNEQISETIEVKEHLDLEIARRVFNEVSEGLTEMDIERFKTLVEDIEVNESADTLKKKLTIIKEANFKKAANELVNAAVAGITEEVVETTDTKTPVAESKKSDDAMINSVVESLDRTSNQRFRRGAYTR